MSTWTIIDVLSTAWPQCTLRSRTSLSSPVCFILSTRVVLAQNALSWTHRGGAKEPLITSFLTLGMPSRNSGRRNPKAAQWTWPYPYVIVPLWSIAGGETSLATLAETATKSTTPAPRLVVTIPDSATNLLIAATLHPQRGSFFSSVPSPSRFGNRSRPPTFKNGSRTASQQINNTRGGIRGGGGGVPKTGAAAALFPALAMFASNRATLRSIAPTLALKFIKLTWPSGSLIMVGSTRCTLDGQSHEAHATFDGDILSSPQPSQPSLAALFTDRVPLGL